MENTMSRSAGRSDFADRPAPRNTGQSAIQHAKFALLWLAVILPLVWGAMDALRDVRYLFR